MNKGFEDMLLGIYREDPCETLPNAFWKTRTLIDDFKTDYRKIDGKVQFLKMWGDQSLHVYWHREGDFRLEDNFVKNVNFILLHAKYQDKIPFDVFSNMKSYFRIIHRHETILEPELPEGFSFKGVDTGGESQEVSDLIGRCYENIKPSADEVVNWTRHEVFDEKLWVWVFDKEEKDYVGLGIADIDVTVPEASLEWIQVLPEYSGHGLGKALVHELLSRVDGKVDFTTVSGEFREDGPMKFYKNCGFQGDDIWWVLRK